MKTDILSKAVAALILMFFLPLQMNASHIVGGEIGYRCLGNNQYEVTLSVYRDCQFGRPDAPLDDPASIGIFSLDNNELITELLIPFIKDDTIRKTIIADTCSVIPVGICVHTTDYRDTVELLPGRGGYLLTYERCCRNQTVSNILQPEKTGASFTITVSEEALNGCNSSPGFREWPPVFICAGAEIDYDHGGIDFEGDSLVYRLCVPLKGASFGFPKPQPPSGPPYNNVQYLLPDYDLNNVLGSGDALKIDAHTGRLTGRPILQGQFVVGICMEEYRNGQLLSKTTRDFQYNVGDCGRVVAYVEPIVQNNHLEVNFENRSFNSNDYLWYFDYPRTDLFSEEDSPTFIYPDTGTYKVALIANPNEFCTDTSFSDIVLKTVLPPVVINHPKDVEVCIEGELLLKVEALSTESLTYQWKKDGVDLIGNTADTMYIEKTDFADGGIYTCEISNTSHTIFSDAALVSVKEKAEFELELSVVDTTICEGEEVLISAILKNGGNAPRFKWLMNGDTVIGQQSASIQVVAGMDGVDLYRCVATTSDDCTLRKVLTASSFIRGKDCISGSEDVFSMNSIKIYPNPVEDFIDVYFTGLVNEDFIIKILNAQGSEMIQKTVLSSQVSKKIRFDAEGFPKGIYFINIASESTAITRSLVKN